MTDIPTTTPNSITTRELLEGIEASVLRYTVDEIRNILSQAAQTFSHHKMTLYANAAELLRQNTAWDEKDKTRWRCMALYHMYLMFYQNHSCEECGEFLKRIRDRYRSALR